MSVKSVVKTIAVLVIAVTMLAVVPISANGSDAYADGSSGYVVKTNEKITAAEQSASGIYKSSILSDGFSDALDAAGFDVGGYGWSKVVSDGGSFNYESTSGMKVEGKTSEMFSSDRVDDVKGVKATYTVTTAKDLFQESDYVTPKTAAVIDAISSCFNTTTFNPGDSLEVVFSGSFISAWKETYTYVDRDSTTCLIKSAREAGASSADLEATITYVPSDDSPKSVTVSLSFSGMSVSVGTYDYGKDPSQVQPGDKVTITENYESVSYDYSLSVYVDGTRYRVDDIDEPTPTPWSWTITADIYEQEDICIDPSYKAMIDALADSDNVKYDKDFSHAESQYDDDFSDASPTSKSKEKTFRIIAVGAIILVGVVFAVAMLKVKKKA